MSSVSVKMLGEGSMQPSVFSVPQLMFKHLRYHTASYPAQREQVTCQSLISQALVSSHAWNCSTNYSPGKWNILYQLIITVFQRVTRPCVHMGEGDYFLSNPKNVRNCFIIPNIFLTRHFCRIFCLLENTIKSITNAQLWDILKTDMHISGFIING